MLIVSCICEGEGDLVTWGLGGRVGLVTRLEGIFGIDPEVGGACGWCDSGKSAEAGLLVLGGATGGLG